MKEVSIYSVLTPLVDLFASFSLFLNGHKRFLQRKANLPGMELNLHERWHIHHPVEQEKGKALVVEYACEVEPTFLAAVVLRCSDNCGPRTRRSIHSTHNIGVQFHHMRNMVHEGGDIWCRIQETGSNEG